MPKIDPIELNTQLIPDFLDGLTNKEICDYLCSCEANAFLGKLLRFYQKMALAKKYTSDGKCFCPFIVEWTTLDGPLVLNQFTLYCYYNYFLGDNTGFAFILRKGFEVIKRNKIRRQMIQDGKPVCEKKCG